MSIKSISINSFTKEITGKTFNVNTFFQGGIGSFTIIKNATFNKDEMFEINSEDQNSLVFDLFSLAGIYETDEGYNMEFDGFTVDITFD